MNTTEYESLINSDVEELHNIAEEAREKRADPKPHVESDIANDIAERCEKLIGVEGLQDLIIKLDEEGYGREEMAFEIAEALAEGEIGDYESDDQKIEAAIRTAVALLTEGVVAAPIDGIGEIKVEENDDGTQFIRVPYFGPIRSAGGTGQALSVLVADHIRQELGLSEFQPREDEIHRYVEEMQLYEETTGLQYTPKEKEVKHIIENCPIMVDGVQTENKEVGGYRDLERIDGNRPRGGMCLVVGEGIAQKAPKIQRYVESVGIDGWDWIDQIVEGTIGKDKDEHETDDTNDSTEENNTETEQTTEEDNDETVESDGGVDQDLIDNTELARFQGNSFDPSKKFKADALSGRPIFGDASQKGTFRLRYGRARNTGLAASGLNPATMYIVDEFIAVGTQLKTERPGKAQGAVPVTSIEGPTVKLYNGTIKQINTIEEAKNTQEKIDEILDLGEMLITHGEFLENNHDLAPAPWTPDWWHREYLHAGGNPDEWEQEDTPTIDEAIQLSHEYDIPLHPEYTFFWSEIEPSDYEHLSTELANTNQENDGETVTITISDHAITILEDLCVEHKQLDDNTIELDINDYRTLTLVCDTNNTHSATDYDTTLDYINEVSPIEIRKRVTLRIGARMGRPEKAAFRKMDDKKINGLFPVEEAGRHKDILSAADDDTGANQNFTKQSSDYNGKGVIETSLPTRECPDCNTETWQIRCPDCNTRTEELLSCYSCGLNGEEHGLTRGDECPDPKCNGKIIAYETQEFNINKQLDNALENLEYTRKTQLNKVKGVEGLSSATKIVEPLEKGILRAKHDIGTFRDGTSRYDMVDLPLTHFKPDEIGLTVEKANELGYTEDIHGNELTDPSQTCELQKQDMIIAENGANYMLQVANYIDELLEDYYDMDPFYNADTIEDLHGHLVAGLAPHTSAAVVGRIIGHTDIQGHYAHPVYHAAKRRNCFHPNTTLTYKLNGEWKNTTIQQLVETHLNPDTDGYDNTYTDGSIVQHLENHPEIEELKVPSMTDDGHRTLEPVTALSKHEPTEEMVTLKFDDGEELTVTPDHNIPIKPTNTNKTFEEKEASQIKPGDTLYDYNNNLLETVKNYPEIDILKHIITDNTLNHEDVMLRGLDKNDLYDLFTDALKESWEDGKFYKLQSTADYLEMSKKTLSNYLYRDSFPLSILLELYDGNKEALVDEMPRDITIGVKRDNTEMPRFVNLDEELATLLGYYTAEGYTRQTKDTRSENDIDGVNQVDLAGIEENARNFFKETLEKKFNVQNPFENEKRVTASGKTLRWFFDEIVDSGTNCYDKTVPTIIENSSNSIKGAYLNGYISGDGSFFRDRIEMSTASEELSKDLGDLFNSLGFDSFESEYCEPKLLREKFPEFYDEDDESKSAGTYLMYLDSVESQEFISKYGIHLQRKEVGSTHNFETKTVETVVETESVKNTYNITVSNTHRLEASQTLSRNCDGDEDSIMLLLDGFLNFSEEYLPDRRGARSMDAPLLMTTEVDPDEIDDEAHNVTTQSYFPLEFYYQSQGMPGPKEVDIPIIEERVSEGGDGLRGVGFTTETDDIGAGVFESRYGQVSGIEQQIERQLELAARSRSVDESMVASKVIDKHVLPTVLGSLNSYTKQDFMCNHCYEIFEFPPFGHECPECGGSLGKTMSATSMENYTQLAQEVAEKYDLSPYMKQRLEVISDRLEHMLENEKNKQAGLGDFM